MQKKDLKHYLLPTEELIPEVVILADGDYPSHAIPLALLKQAQHVVCCDGAANQYIENGFTPDIIVGDGDSLSPENKAKHAGIIYYSSNQETNDLTKAVEYCVSQRKKNIVILGATGKREDHTIGNISLLTDYMDVVEEVQIISDYGVFTPIKTDSAFECFPGQAVSIFNLKPNPVRGRGLEYPLGTFTNWWQGTLNKAYSHSFTILARNKVIVYRAF